MPAAFPKIPRIRYEGPRSKNPLAFKHYNAEERVEGRAMRDHLRFSVVYWHTLRGMGSDMFGSGTMQRPWEDGTNSLRMALKRVPVLFEFCEKLGAHSTPSTTATSRRKAGISASRTRTSTSWPGN